MTVAVGYDAKLCKYRQILFAVVPSAHARLIADDNGLIVNLVYFNNPAVVAKLSCPVGGTEVWFNQITNRGSIMLLLACLV